MRLNEFDPILTESLAVGDPVIITGDVGFRGKTGDVRDLGQNGSFVVVDLYNYGPQSFQASDVSRNDYADSQDDEEVAEDSNDDINDYYAGYYADLLSQIENMSVTDQVDTKLGIKRTLENGELRLVDLKSEIKALEREINRTKQGVAEVSKATLDRYVTKASDAHGAADFAARMSKHDPDKRSYHVDQKNTAEKRRQGISRALDRMSRPDDVVEQERVGNMDADRFDAAMARLKQLAGAGPLKTVYDPQKRVYRNVPTAVQPPTQPKK